MANNHWKTYVSHVHCSTLFYNGSLGFGAYEKYKPGTVDDIFNIVQGEASFTQ